MNLSGSARQILITIFANLLSCSVGTLMGWASSGMMFLESEDSDLNTGTITRGESAVINSMYSVGGLLGTIAGGLLVNRIGRIWSMKLLAVMQIISCVLVGFAESMILILLSRVCAGFAAGVLYVTLPLFVAEIAQNSNRGRLGSIFAIAVGTGLLLSYILGAVMPYNTCVWVYIVFPAVFIFLTDLVPESPVNYLMKKKFDEAKSSMLFYRGATEMEGIVQLEFEALKKYLEESSEETKLSLSDFRPKRARKAIIIGIFLIGLEQFSGCFAMLFLVASVFKNAGATAISPELSTIIVGLIQLVGAYGSTFTVDRIGRKPLLIASAFGISAGMTIFAVTTQLIEHGYDSNFLKLIPVFALSFSIMVANVGVFALTFIILPEITPPKISNFVFTSCMMLSWIFTVVVFNILPPLTDAFGEGGAMYFFAVYTLLSGLFVIYYIPETKEKSFEEIGKIMDR